MTKHSTATYLELFFFFKSMGKLQLLEQAVQAYPKQYFQFCKILLRNSRILLRKIIIS